MYSKIDRNWSTPFLCVRQNPCPAGKQNPWRTHSIHSSLEGCRLAHHPLYLTAEKDQFIMSKIFSLLFSDFHSCKMLLEFWSILLEILRKEGFQTHLLGLGGWFLKCWWKPTIINQARYIGKSWWETWGLRVLPAFPEDLAQCPHDIRQLTTACDSCSRDCTSLSGYLHAHTQAHI